MQLALAMSKGINAGIVKEMSARGVSYMEYFSRDAQYLAAKTGAKASRFDDSRREAELAAARREAMFMQEKNITALFPCDAAYPYRLRECPDAPAVLFVLGEMKTYRHVLAVVGTRHCTIYGKTTTERIVTDLASMVNDLLIVSGLAYGVDIYAHRAALSCNVPTAAVFAHGLNTIYPTDHRKFARDIVKADGFLATEYPSSAQIHKGNFLSRNRIVAGMADATLVVESDDRGGAMVTARMASDYAREVFAVPGRVSDQYSRGCNRLIANDTARICTCADDIVDLLNWERKPKEGTQCQMTFEMPEKFRAVADALRANPGVNINDLACILAMPVSRLQSLLFEMEMNDLGTTLPGGHFALNNEA